MRREPPFAQAAGSKQCDDAAEEMAASAVAAHGALQPPMGEQRATAGARETTSREAPARLARAPDRLFVRVHARAAWLGIHHDQRVRHTRNLAQIVMEDETQRIRDVFAGRQRFVETDCVGAKVEQHGRTEKRAADQLVAAAVRSS